MSAVAFIDTETAGLDPEFHHVWEIAVIVDGVEHCWQQRLPAYSVVDQWVLDNTRFSQDYNVDTALNQLESFDRFVGLVAGRHLVGACPWFDSERLHRQQLELGRSSEHSDRRLPWHYHLIDIENLAVGYLLGKGSQMSSPQDWQTPLPWDSAELSRRVGVDPADFEPKHSALTDARWAKAIYEKITEATS